MSRTRHHRMQRRQHVGEDFWSKRAGMGYYPYCTYGKMLTVIKERMEEKQEISKILKSDIDDILLSKDESIKKCESLLPTLIEEMEKGNSPEMAIWCDMESDSDYHTQQRSAQPSSRRRVACGCYKGKRRNCENKDEATLLL